MKLKLLPVIALFCAAPQIIRAQAKYRIVALLPEGATRSEPAAMNNRGDIIVKASRHFYLYHDGKAQRIAALDSGSYEVNGLNDQGDIVGNRYTRSNCVGFLLRKGKITLLGELNGAWITATGLNAQGDIVGYKLISRMKNGNYVLVSQRAFRYHQSKMEDLGAFHGHFTTAWAINDKGEIVGCSDDAIGNYAQALLWQNGVKRAFASPEIGLTTARALNDVGDVVGAVRLDNGLSHAFLYHAGKFEDLGAAGEKNSIALFINNRGDIGGRLDKSEEESLPCLYSEGKWKPLDSLLAKNSQWKLIAVSGLNNDGFILGFGLHNGKERVFLMQPVPAPQNKK